MVLVFGPLRARGTSSLPSNRVLGRAGFVRAQPQDLTFLEGGGGIGRKTPARRSVGLEVPFRLRGI